jgi:hypothetical protein
MSDPNSAKVEVLKVWYSVFCALMDDKAQYTNDHKILKLAHLRQMLRDAYPQLEEELAKGRQ